MKNQEILNELYSLFKSTPKDIVWNRFLTGIGDQELSWYRCWEWAGTRNKSNYGTITSEGTGKGVHRVVCTWLYGNLPYSLVVDHVVCDNPPCCNPLHLIPNTRWFNNIRGINPTGAPTLSNTCRNGHLFTEENTYYNPNNKSRRCCRICRYNCNVRNLERNREKYENDRRTHCSNGHELNLENTYISPRYGFKLCKICRLTQRRIRENGLSREGAELKPYKYSIPKDKKDLAVKLIKDGLSNKEIHVATGIKRSTVKSIRHSLKVKDTTYV